jgi:hypothetical protein
MQVRHIVIAALFAAAGAVQADNGPSGLQSGRLSGMGGTTTVVPMPSALDFNPAPPVATQLPPAPPQAAEVPEPSSIALLLAGVAGAGLLRRRRAK